MALYLGSSGVNVRMGEVVETAPSIVDEILMKTVTSYSNSTITTVGNYAFYSCKFLASINLPKVTSIGRYAFYGCSSLNSLSLPEVINIDSNAFFSCSHFSTVPIHRSSRKAAMRSL